MKRTVICNIPMKRDIANSVYTIQSINANLKVSHLDFER